MESQEPEGTQRGWAKLRPSGAAASSGPRPLPAPSLSWLRPLTPLGQGAKRSLEVRGSPIPPPHPSTPTLESGGDSGFLEWASKISQ